MNVSRSSFFPRSTVVANIAVLRMSNTNLSSNLTDLS